MMTTIDNVPEVADAARISNGRNYGDGDGDLGCESVSSSSSYHYDDPYHETAAEWFQRHSRRRARRLCGMSSSDSDDSDETITDESGVSHDGEEDTTGVQTHYQGLRKSSEKAALAPLMKNWLRSYPGIAARCCFSVPSIDQATSDRSYLRSESRSFHSHDNLFQSPRLTRSEETKKLRRIVRRLRKKECDLHMTPHQDAPTSNPIHHHYNSNELVDSDRVAVDSFLPNGSGISFIDAILARGSILTSNMPRLTFPPGKINPGNNVVLEVNGPSRSGKSSILLALAARYIACTSPYFMNPYGANYVSSDLHYQNKRQKPDCFATLDYFDEPKAVILDLEHGIHTDKLILTVKEAVIRRWEETSAARRWMAKHQQIWSDRNKCMENGMDGGIGLSNESCDYTVNEQQQIDTAIAYCLGRMHIIQPRDFTYLNLVATLESLRQSLQNDQMQRQHIRNTPHPLDTPPTLLLLDSLTTLDEFTRVQEGLPTSRSSSNRSRGSGLSEKNEFYRQLVRLREEHSVMIVAASKNILGSSIVYDGERRDKELRRNRTKGDAWDKLVTHHVALHHVAEGTMEDQNGYDFVATLSANNQNGDINIFPYAVTAGGIRC